MANCNYKVNIKDIQSKYSFKIFCSSDNAEIQAEIGNLENLTTTAKNNLVSAINEVDGNTTTNATAISGLQNSKEDKSNKVTTITSSSTDTQYPSAKLLYNQLALKENIANKTTTLSSSSTDTQYPSAKAVYDSQETQNETISTLESNLEETQAELDYYKTIYNVLPKVTGNGESITLDNTGESILKLDPRGQCKQDSTTGKNLLNCNSLTESTTNNVKFTPVYENGLLQYINVNGTASDNAIYFLKTDPYNIPQGSYIISGCPSGGSPSTYKLDVLNSSGAPTYVDTGSGADITLSEDLTSRGIRIVVYSGTQLNNAKFYPMIRLSTISDDTYEPYTGGIPSPNPSYPYPIHEISGDNEINVCGKNLFDGVLETGIYDGTTGQPVANSSYMRSKNYIAVDELTDYSITSIDISNVNIAVYEYTADYSFNLSTNKIIYAGNTLLTTNSGTKFIKFRPMVENNNLSSRFMLNKGGTSATYEPYNGDTYELDLGVENFLPYTNQDFTLNGVRYYAQNGNLYLDGTSSGETQRTNSNFKDNFSFYLNAGTYILKQNKLDSGNANYFVKYLSKYNDDTSLGFVNNTTTSATITITERTQVYLGFYVYQKTFSNETFNLQLEEGTKANSYSPYGQTPIKMRGIGTYEDYFTKNTGKNLVEDKITDANVYSDGRLLAYTTGNYDIQIAKIEQGKTYTISTDEGQLTAGFFTSKPVLGSTTYDNSRLVDNNKTFTAPITGYIAFRTSYGYQFAQCELGSQATTYEPYGTGQWCKYNAIEKKVLDGSETWNDWSANRTTTSLTGYKKVGASTVSLLYSNYYKRNTRNNSAVDFSICFFSSEDTTNGIIICDSVHNLGTLMKSWLQTNNVDVYYVLETPYLSLIESTTLQNQLDKLEKALGKDGTTNISQVNNDTPFKIYASALKEIE